MEHLTDRTIVKIEQLRELHTELFKDIKWLNLRITIYINKSRLEGSRLRKENLIYLLRRNIKTTKLSDKLDSKKISLFRVKRNIKNISFELYLPSTIKIHPIFYIFLLEPADPNTPKKLALKLDSKIEELIYNIEEILAVRKRRNKL